MSKKFIYRIRVHYVSYRATKQGNYFYLSNEMASATR